MILCPYNFTLLTVTLILGLYVFLISFSQRTSGQYETRNVLLRVVDYSKLPQFIDDKPDSLKEFYTSLLDAVELHKLPFGYEIKKLRLFSDRSVVDLLSLYEGKSEDFIVGGDVRFQLVLYNSERQVYGESSCYLTLNASKLWELNSHVITFLLFDRYDVVCFCGTCCLVVVLMLYMRNRYTYALAATNAIYMCIEIAKRLIMSRKGEWRYVIPYLRISSLVTTVALIMLAYITEVDIVRKHDIFHTVFCKIANNASLVVFSIFIIPFVHYIGVSIFYLFLWLPLLCCTVLSTIKQLMKEAKKMAENDESMEAQQKEDIEHISEAEQVPVSYDGLNKYSCVLIFLMIVSTVLLILLCFKRDRQVDDMKMLYNAMNAPFRSRIATYATTKPPGNNDLSLRIQQKEKDVDMNVTCIRTVPTFVNWMKATFPVVDIMEQTYIIVDNSRNSAAYRIKDLNQVDSVMGMIKTLACTVLLVFQTSKTNIIYSMLKFGRNDIGIGEFEESRLYSISTTPEYLSLCIGLAMLVLSVSHCYVDMKEDNLLGNFKAFWDLGAKNKTRIAVLFTMCFMIFGFIICRTIFVFAFSFDASSVFNGEGDVLGNAVSVLRATPAVSFASDVFVFSNVICTLVYITMTLPRYYYFMDNKGEFIKRKIVSERGPLLTIVYQYCILLVLWSLLGNIYFGISNFHFRSFFTTLRYNIILGFNKVLTSQNDRQLYFYNGISILLFYNIGLTSFLAIYCHKSWVNKHKVANLEAFDKYKDSFKVDIMASLEDIVCFKVFIKSVDAHKKYVNMKSPEEDHCEAFFKRFFQEGSMGMAKLKPKITVNMYLERIKKYLLCITFLRMKMRNLSMSINEIEELKTKRKPINESKRSYLSMLKKKLHITVEEIKTYKRSTEIMMAMAEKEIKTGRRSRIASARGEMRNDTLDSYSSVTEEVYDKAELERFLLGTDNVIRCASTSSLNAHPPSGSVSIVSQCDSDKANTSSREINQEEDNMYHTDIIRSEREDICEESNKSEEPIVSKNDVEEAAPSQMPQTLEREKSLAPEALGSKVDLSIPKSEDENKSSKDCPVLELRTRVLSVEEAKEERDTVEPSFHVPRNQGKNGDNKIGIFNESVLRKPGSD
ncbi:hypothetical protein BgAZ_102330 [Babesia gibsoni]|uniref:Uncharacterized protein n=1 Tax=Babesia gibsoni TaxID=33632 RepID=A0AAD8UTN7_BABGI|nr:hypothetical protein BgAZ_102330 [Babesia gibsoni]